MAPSCLIVGVNSMLATAIVEQLGPTWDVTGVYHERQDQIAPGVRRVAVRDLPTLPDTFDVVYLLSAYIPAGGESIDHQRLFEVNVGLTERVCAQFRRARVVFTSSVSVYGTPLPDEVLTESSPGRQPGPYGLSKLWAEAVVAAHPRFAIVRIASMYGSQMRPTTFLPFLTLSALRQQRLPVLGTGARLQSYIHAADVAACCVRAADPATPSGRWLAAAPAAISNLDVARLLHELHPAATIEQSGTDTSPSFQYDAAATYQTLGWRPQVSLRDGLAELLAALAPAAVTA